MESTTAAFRENTAKALGDAKLRDALSKLTDGFPARRREAIARLPEFDALRDAARDIKDHVLANLDFYLEAFEARVVEAGGTVHIHAMSYGEKCESPALWAQEPPPSIERPFG